MNPATGTNVSSTKTAATTSAATFYGTIGVVMVVIALLVFIDVRLARVETAESQAEAERYFREGQESAKNGDYAQAVERFRTAASVQRNNMSVRVALAQALFSAGRVEDARTAASQILESDPTNADASLIMARILKTDGNIDEAAIFYHRAIYGRWLQDPVKSSVDTRLELADLLAANNRTEDLLPELVALQDEATDDVGVTRRIAHLYVAAGVSERASELFTELLKQNPNDADAYAGLGEAEFARANYRTARRNFETALKIQPESPEILSELDLTDQVLTLDPLGRGISSQARYERSRMLLEMAANSLKECAGANPDYAVTAMVEQAQTQLDRRVTTSQRNEAVDKNLDLAEQVWTLRGQTCGAPANPSDKAVDLVLSRVAQ